jgi:hypothetical protein
VLPNTNRSQIEMAFEEPKFRMWGCTWEVAKHFLGTVDNDMCGRGTWAKGGG